MGDLAAKYGADLVVNWDERGEPAEGAGPKIAAALGVRETDEGDRLVLPLFDGALLLMFTPLGAKLIRVTEQYPRLKY